MTVTVQAFLVQISTLLKEPIINYINRKPINCFGLIGFSPDFVFLYLVKHYELLWFYIDNYNGTLWRF